MGATGQIYTQDLHASHLPGQKSSSTITIRAEEVKSSNDLVVFAIAASGLPQKHKRVLMKVKRTTETGDAIPCFRTAVANVLQGNCAFPEAKVSLQILANGDPYRPLLVECLAYQTSGDHKFLGLCKLSVDDMVSKARSGKKVKLSENAGEVTIVSCNLHPQPSFFDYLAGGMQMQFSVAIDYTASNGNPCVASSLHYNDPFGRKVNEYAHALSSVGNILEFYDADKRFPAFGFGGCPIPNQPVQHSFALNGDEQDPEVHGIDGILSTYRESLRWVRLSGPTLFAPVISKAAAIAASLRTPDPARQTYSVLMILTDGMIHDMDNTKDVLVAAADEPFSVIIVGVGDNEDFSAMRELDGDDMRIADSNGKKASRDIVQFVPMHDMRDKGFHALAREVLAEIPSQVVEYMHNNGIKPVAPVASY